MVEGIAAEGVSVVIRGAVNPPIITPQWLLDQAIIGAQDFEKQDIEIISREFVSFSLGWLRFNATLDSMQFGTADPDEFLRVRDAAVRTLELLNHTPIATLGINRDFHSLVDKVTQFHAIGDGLAPKQPWQTLLVLPGMRDVSIQGVRPDLYTGHVQVAVQPSALYPKAVFVLHNDHFELTTVESQMTERPASWEFSTPPEASPAKNAIAVRVLRDVFEDSLMRAEQVREAIMAIGLEQ